jgi:hypothetical protein
MSKQETQRDRAWTYEAPPVFVIFFYTLLTLWTLACVVLLGLKYMDSGWPLGQLLMIAFVLAYTWYFSLGIAYHARIEGNGQLHFKSFRRTIQVTSESISLIEGPRLALLPFCFIRFRQEREKAYLFCRITDASLRTFFNALRDQNPGAEFKGLGAV